MRTLVLGLLLLAGTACSLGGGVQIQHDGEVRNRLKELSATAGSAKLADLHKDPWDAVHVFSEGASAESVEKAVGQEVLRGKYYADAGSLLVFTNEGKVIAAISVVPDILATNGRTTWGNKTRVEPRGTRTPAVLQLVEP